MQNVGIAGAKVVVTDYPWKSLDVELQVLAGANLVALQTKTPDQFLSEAADCDALLNTYAGPIDVDVIAKMPQCKIIARYGVGVDTMALLLACARINCSRGPIVDTAALVRALDGKAIAGCALDTTDPEPLPDPHPLRGRDNVVINPHAAWYSEQAQAGLQSGAPNEVRRVLCGEWPLNPVNPAVRGRSRAGL
jgi:phosphoglycerate dehydrogenase-like enzyme